MYMKGFATFYSRQKQKRRKHATSTKLGQKRAKKMKQYNRENRIGNDYLQQIIGPASASLTTRGWRTVDIKYSTLSCANLAVRKLTKK